MIYNAVVTVLVRLYAFVFRIEEVPLRGDSGVREILDQNVQPLLLCVFFTLKIAPVSGSILKLHL